MFPVMTTRSTSRGGIARQLARAAPEVDDRPRLELGSDGDDQVDIVALIVAVVAGGHARIEVVKIGGRLPVVEHDRK